MFLTSVIIITLMFMKNNDLNMHSCRLVWVWMLFTWSFFCVCKYNFCCYYFGVELIDLLNSFTVKSGLFKYITLTRPNLYTPPKGCRNNPNKTTFQTYNVICENIEGGVVASSHGSEAKGPDIKLLPTKDFHKWHYIIIFS